MKTCKIHKIGYEMLWDGVYLCERCFSDYHHTIKGQIPSGKNAVGITKYGHRYPTERFQKWKQEHIDVWPSKQIDHPVSVLIKYYPGDKRRRDVPGMEDALWHLIERSGFITDDFFLGGTGNITIFKNMGLSRGAPRVEISISIRKKVDNV